MDSHRCLLFGLFLNLMLTAVPARAQSSICYAKPGGNDLNDGSYWAFAKADVMACYDALPPAGGTIYIMGGGKTGEGIPACRSTDPRGCGIWIMGAHDPNYTHPRAGWRKAKPVQFIGVGVNISSQQGKIPQVSIAAGDGSHPGIWLSSANISVSFENLSMAYPNPSIEIGVDSNGANTVTSSWVGANFSNVATLDCNGCASTNGPGWLIEGFDTFDIDIKNSVIQGNQYATPGADNQSAILIKPYGAGGSAIGLVHIEDTVVSGGGIKVYGGGNGASISVRDTYSESINGGSLSPGPATVWLAGGPGPIYANIQNVSTSDATSNVYDVRNDLTTGSPPEAVQVIGTTANVYGPALVMAQMPGGAESPLRSRQSGFLFNHVMGFSGNAQRQFGLYSVAYSNLIGPESGWQLAGSGGSLTTGITGPDGTANAVQLNGATTATVRFVNGGISWVLGDYWIASEWVRSPGGNYGTQGASFLYQSANSGDAWTCQGLNPPIMGDGEWEFKSEICKVTVANVSPNGLIVSEGLNATNTTQVYAPQLIRIPAGTVSDNEAYEIWNNLSSYSNTCPLGAMCGLPGKPVVVSSYGTLSNCSSSASPAACGSAAAGSVVIASGSASVVVDTTEVTANSQITLTFDSSLRSRLRVTCNSTAQQPYVSARTAGRSFTISVPNNFTTNPGCISYSITN